MPPTVVNNAMLRCSFGMAPSTLSVLPLAFVDGESQPAASVMDHQPMLNIKPFGMCTSLANPQVAAATAAAMGALTPMPCIPMTLAPWIPGSLMVKVGGQAALTTTSTCQCNWGGVIQIGFAGTVLTETT